MDGGRSIQAMTGVFQVGDAVLSPFRASDHIRQVTYSRQHQYMCYHFSAILED